MKFSAAEKRLIKKVAFRVFILISVIVMASYYMIYRYVEEREREIVLKSRYTFAVRIDSHGNVLEPAAENSVNHTLADDFAQLTIGQIGDIWIRQFTSQYTQKYLSRTKKLEKVDIHETKILEEKTNTVFISFTAIVDEDNYENFIAWDGVVDNGKLICEWVVSFNIDNHYDGTATIYVKSIVTPEEYGITMYNESKKNLVAEKADVTGAEENENEMVFYRIKNAALTVTYNKGERYITVPVNINDVLYEDNSTDKLKYGSYCISTTKTAFLYGGKRNGNDRIPITLVYTDDMGENWITSEIDTIYNANYYYVEFFDEKTGIIFVGYDRNNLKESYKIYVTSDGGQSWNPIADERTGNIIKGVKFIDSSTGFLCYEYSEEMDSNLYRTADGGKTFEKVVLESQELDSTALQNNSNLTWSDVYREATVPTYGSDRIVTVYLMQGEQSQYNNGKTVAKYQSTDKGKTFKYIGQYEKK